MATWRDTNGHDLGDENDRCEFAFLLREGDKCPFCDDPYVFSASYLTPVFRYSKRRCYTGGDSYYNYKHRELVDKITTCDAESCLKIAGDLAAKWEKRINAGVST
jgi:hypothetical protein